MNFVIGCHPTSCQSLLISKKRFLPIIHVNGSVLVDTIASQKVLVYQNKRYMEIRSQRESSFYHLITCLEHVQNNFVIGYHPTSCHWIQTNASPCSFVSAYHSCDWISWYNSFLRRSWCTTSCAHALLSVGIYCYSPGRKWVPNSKMHQTARYNIWCVLYLEYHT